jgi:hypothetical protein
MRQSNRSQMRATVCVREFASCYFHIASSQLDGTFGCGQDNEVLAACTAPVAIGGSSLETQIQGLPDRLLH